jgi:hypothetical protein
MFGLSHLAGRIILAPMSALLSPVQKGDIWRVKIVWPNRAVHFVGKFTSEKDALRWINAHPQLTKSEGKRDEQQNLPSARDTPGKKPLAVIENQD